MDYLLRPAPPILSRRASLVAEDTGTDVTRESERLEVALVAWLHDVRQLLIGLNVLQPRASIEGPRRQWIRRRLPGNSLFGFAGNSRPVLEPIESLMELCERAGQYVLVTELPGDGASVVDGDVAAAVVSIRGDPGRRRATAAHELGHLVIGDEYSNDLGVHASRADREAVLDAFAAEPPATDASPHRNRPGGWHNPGSTDRACSPLPDFVVIGYPASRPCRSADRGGPS